MRLSTSTIELEAKSAMSVMAATTFTRGLFRMGDQAVMTKSRYFLQTDFDPRHVENQGEPYALTITAEQSGGTSDIMARRRPGDSARPRSAFVAPAFPSVTYDRYAVSRPSSPQQP